MLEFFLVSVSVYVVVRAIKYVYAQGEAISDYFSSED
jgi:hypothetical protein